MSKQGIEERLARLEDIEAIRLLKARYARFCDDDYNPEALAPLFTENAIWDGGPLGRFEGREAIRTFFSNAASVMPYAIHHVTNPEIEVAGDRAEGRWLLWQPCVHAEGDQALWMAGAYHDQYRREAGEWRFADVQITLKMLSPYEAGWSQARMIEVPA